MNAPIICIKPIAQDVNRVKYSNFWGHYAASGKKLIEGIDLSDFDVLSLWEIGAIIWVLRNGSNESIDNPFNLIISA